MSRLEESGLWVELLDAGFVIPQERVDLALAYSDEAIAVLRPQQLGAFMYPYEWSFSQLKDAALLTLEIARRALGHKMMLKDATAYNIQFVLGKPILVDTLSFECRDEPLPWNAYRQFCQHFLAPLALMAHVDVRLIDLLRIHLDGIPLDLAAKLLPGRTKLNPGLLTHLHLHASAIHAASGGESRTTKAVLADNALLGLLDHLKSTIEGMKWDPKGTEWGDYYADTNYTRESADAKARLVQQHLQNLPETARTCWDLGANTGRYSLLAAERGLETIAWDIDPAAVEHAYSHVRRSGIKNLQPARIDLSNPSPGLGWLQTERDGFLERGPADVVMALALVHHLCLTYHAPLAGVVDLLSRAGNYVIIEFVPHEDSQVKRMLKTHSRRFEEYTLDAFRASLSERFEFLAEDGIPGTVRTLFFARRRS